MKRRILKVLWVCLLLIQLSSACKTGCSSCDGTQSACYQCANPNDQIMNDGSCGLVSATISNCYVYSQGSGCARCSINYVLRAGACFQDTTGCLTFTPDGQCLRCGFGATLASGRCVGVINCDTYVNNNPTSCASCAPTFVLTDGVCFPAGGQCSNFNQGICTNCAPGFTSNGFNCIQGSLAMRGCAIYLNSRSCMYCN